MTRYIEAPIHATWPVVETWLTSFGPPAAPLVAAAAWTPVLSTAGIPAEPELLTDLWTTGANLSWLGGPAIACSEPWPRDAAGRPLAHVATFALHDVAGVSYDVDKAPWPDHRQGLPTTGVLEVFHDLTTGGWAAKDADHRGWHVRWVLDVDRSRLVWPPDDAPSPTDEWHAGDFLAGFTVPSPADVAAHGKETADVAQRVQDFIHEGWAVQVFGQSTGLPRPMTHAFGHSPTGTDAVAGVLASAVPIADDDEHRLLFSIEPSGHLAGWFDRDAPLEVWIRESDLLERRFDRAWCLVRHDGADQRAARAPHLAGRTLSTVPGAQPFVVGSLDLDDDAGEVPVHGDWPDVAAWLATFGPAAASLRDSAAWSPVFAPQGLAPDPGLLDQLWGSGSEVSWLGGPSVPGLPAWPRNADGLPLAHVMTVALDDVRGGTGAEARDLFPEHRAGLPPAGTLEVFHDLVTHGWDAEDADRGGWVVRWAPEPDRSPLVPPPNDLDPPTPVCQPGRLLPGFTIPSVHDLAARGEGASDAVERAHVALARAWQSQVFGQDAPATSVTHVYGHSQHGAGAIAEVLARVLPLSEPGDRHRLLLDVESWTHLAGWFGDAAPLEVWMRATDLDARLFDRAWCIMRTD